MAERTNADHGLVDAWTAELGGPQTTASGRIPISMTRWAVAWPNGSLMRGRDKSWARASSRREILVPPPPGRRSSSMIKGRRC